jgi:hypothetical protein
MSKKRARTRDGMVTTTIALDESLHRELLIAAVEHRMAMTELVRRVLREWLDRHGRKGGK